MAEEVVALIQAAGGEAVANSDSVEQGDRIVAAALAAYGRLDIVVNNAAVITPEPWADLTLESWQRTLADNLTGIFTLMKAAWPVFVRQRYGRALMMASPSIHGAGVAAYSASKAALVGLAASLQFEARKLKLDIRINTVIPQADTRMTRGLDEAVNDHRVKRGRKPVVQPPHYEQAMALMAPEKVSALVAWLCHPTCPAEATIHEAGAGYFAQLRWQRSAPLFATAAEGVAGAPTPEHVRAGAATLADFGHGDAPRSGDGSMGAPLAAERVLGHLTQHRSRL